MEMHNPAHPGEVIREACLKPLGLTVTAAAEGLGVTRKTLSDLLNGHSGVSPRYVDSVRKGRMEYGGGVAAYADELRPVARQATF